MSDNRELTALTKQIFDEKIKPGELAEMINPEGCPIWLTDPDALNPYKELSPLQTWCNIGSRPAIPREGVITFQAKQKQGKSLSTYALAIPLLSGIPFDTLTPNDRPNLILVFDMEMSETTLINRALNQVRNIGEHGTRFVIFPLKAKSIADRMRIIADKINRYNPGIVVIDQTAKLVNNVNDFEECSKLVDWLDKLSIGRSVWAVCHENKSDDDRNMRGHLGTCLSQANVEAYSVAKKEGVFTITYLEGRDTESDGAAPVHFAMSDGMIKDPAEELKAAKEKELKAWSSNFGMIFGNDMTLTHGGIIDRIKQTEGLEETAAKTKLTKAKELGVIRKTGAGKFDPYELVHFDA